MDTSKLNLLSDSALRQLNTACCNIIRQRQRDAQLTAGRALKIGSIASFVSSKHGRVIKIRIDKRNVKTVSGTEVDPITHKPTHMKWNVSPTLLTLVITPASDTPMSGVATF